MNLELTKQQIATLLEALDLAEDATDEEIKRYTTYSKLTTRKREIAELRNVVKQQSGSR